MQKKRSLREQRFSLVMSSNSSVTSHSRQGLAFRQGIRQQQAMLAVPRSVAPEFSLPARLLNGFLRAWEERPMRNKLVASGAIVIASTAMMAGSLGWARRATVSWKNWRAEAKIEQAEARFESEDFGTGFLLASEACRDAPANEKAIRCLARRWEEVGSSKSLYFVERLEKIGKLTREDQITKLAALINERRFKEAQSLAVELCVREDIEPRLVKLGCEIGRAGFQIPPALRAKAVASLTLTHSHNDVLDLASVMIGTNDHERAAAALWNIVERAKPAVARKAARVLHDHTPFTAPSSAYLAWVMTELPDADATLRASALERAIKSDPSKAGQILKQAVIDWSIAPLADRAILGRLISSCRQPTSLVGLFGHDEATTDPVVANLYAESLLAHGRVEESVALLKDERLPVSRAQRAYGEAVITLHATADVDERRFRLLCALDASGAEANVNLLIGVAELATGCGQIPVAERAYDECRHLRGAREAAMDGLIALYETHGSTEKLLATTQEAMLMWPGNERYLEKNVYASLLLGQNMEEAAVKAESLLEKRPTDEVRLFLASMAHARMGNATMARCELRKLSVSRNIPPRYRAVIGGLLKSVGDSQSASDFVIDVSDQEVPLPEEKAFLALARL
ncbi:MAG: hypothetical protein K1X78_09455 [Verrucomicrobiaceae bacterium]|nr:hypothetical protein [Verrucomicrobiaceae bacterium]